MAQLKCPNCGREFVRRVSRAGPLELFLSYFYVYPFKCQLCGDRFRLFQWGVRYVRVEEDRREYDRMEMNFPVSFYGQDVAGEGNVESHIHGRLGMFPVAGKAMQDSAQAGGTPMLSEHLNSIVPGILAVVARTAMDHNRQSGSFG